MRVGAAVAVAAGLAIVEPAARAGGMMLPVQGLRDLSRAGAFVAGVDDASALFVNPAGLALLAGDGHRALLFDVAYVQQRVQFTGLDSAGRAVPQVSSQASGQTIPTLAAALGIGPKLVIAGGVSEPYAGLGKYDDTGPQRYAGISLTGSSFVRVTLGAAYALTPELRVGATVQDLISTVGVRIALSDCQGEAACSVTDTSFDAVSQINQRDYVAPSGSIGVQYDATPRVRVGASLQAPTRVSAEASFETRLPSSPAFSGAMITGTQGAIGFTLPPVLRAGVEARVTPHVRVEAALDVEFWSVQDDLKLVPDHVQLVTAGGIATTLSTLTIPRNYQTSFAASLGGEARFGDFMIAAGYAYETAAAPPAYVTVLTVDAPKHILGLGFTYEIDDWSIGLGGGLALLESVDVSAAEARVPQLTPLRAPGAADAYVNAGDYHSMYLVGGARATRSF